MQGSDCWRVVMSFPWKPLDYAEPEGDRGSVGIAGSAFALENRGIPRSTSVRIRDVLSEIRTDDLPKTISVALLLHEPHSSVVVFPSLLLSSLRPLSCVYFSFSLLWDPGWLALGNARDDR